MVEWGPCVIDLAKEASVMHLTLTSQIHTVQPQLSKVCPSLPIMI